MSGREVEPHNGDRLRRLLTPARPARSTDSARLADTVDAGAIARIVGALWHDASISDTTLATALDTLTVRMGPAGQIPRVGYAGFATDALLGLVPAVRDPGARPALAATMRTVAASLRRIVESGNATATDVETARLSMASASLVLTARQSPQPRAAEYLRRASRTLVHSSEGATVDPLIDVDAPAALALALAASGQRGDALSLLATLARSFDVPDLRWSDPARALAVATMAQLLPPHAAPITRAQVRVDGREADVPMTEGSGSTESPALSRPGAHAIELFAPDGGVLLARARSRYARPWNGLLRAQAPFALALEGAPVGRGTRAGFALRVQNRGPRLLPAPVFEIELPAGAEIDQPARNEIARRAGRTAAIDGRTLVIRTRAMPPGATVRVPLAIRWTVGGRLRGMGVAAYTSDAPGAAVSVLPAASFDVPDATP
jgi:hypothetical protein